MVIPFESLCLLLAASALIDAKPSLSAAAGTCNCGVKGADRIVSGSDAGIQEYPWMVQLHQEGGEFFCGGSIIAPEWVLTAAHCTEGIYPEEIKVRAGSYYLTVGKTTQARSAARIEQHPLYNNKNLDNDISLIQVSQPFVYNAAVSPVCLPFNFSTFNYSKQIATSTGWGHTSHMGELSIKLLEATTELLSAADCRKQYRVGGAITDNMICKHKGGPTCQGDSGGPANWIDQTSKRAFVVGITSWGQACSYSKYPGACAKVTNYLGWITTTTGLTFCSP